MGRKPDDPTILRLKGREVPLAISRHARARRITLRLDGANGGFKLTLPRRTPLAEGLGFAERKAGWILAQLDALPAHVPFAPGATVPILGRDHLIVHRPEARRGVWREEGRLLVSGQTEHLARRIADFLKTQARGEISARAYAKARVIDRPVKRICVRDTTSRWGSCSADGGLNFSWRLVLAPESVLDYVVAHEVAHLVEMNHGRRFWALVRRLTPEVGAPRRWLREQGDRLLRYG